MATTTRQRGARRRTAQPQESDDALGHVPARLAAAAHVDQFFGQMLQEFTERFHPVLCVLWLHRDTEIVRLARMLVDGRVLSPAQAAEHFPDYPSLQPFRVQRRVNGGFPVTKRRHHILITDIRVSPLFLAVVGTDGIAWYDRHGVRQELNLPLVIGEKTVGVFSLYLGPEHIVTPEQVKLALALAQQATLVLEVTRLADAEKAAAIAHEREEAAREQAAEQARTNETLTRSMAQLVSHNDLTGFLNTVLLEAIASAGAVSGTVFLHDPANDTLVQTAHVMRGKVIDVARDPQAEVFREPILAKGDPIWDLFREGRSFVLEDYAQPQPALWAEYGAWHRAMGHRFAAAVPMVHDGRSIGMIGVAWDQAVETRPEGSQLRVCQALAHHAMLAVRLTRLAEEARRVAVASEREQAERERAAELAKANEVLRRNLAVLSGGSQIDLFFDHLFRTLMEQFNPVMCNVWWVRDDGRVELNTMLVDGQVLKLPQVMERFPDFPSPEPFHVPPAIIDGETAATRQRLFHLPDIRVAPLFHRLIGQAGIDWYTRRGVRQDLNIPLHIGERSFGSLSLFFDEKYIVTSEKVELCFALAQQAALAFELTRLAAAEKAAAVARELEQAAQERAAEQERVNEAFSRSIAKLVSHNDLTDFLNAVLQEAIGHSGAASGVVMLYDRTLDALVQKAHVVRGRVVDVDTDPAVAVFRRLIPTEGDPVWRRMSEGREFFFADYADPHPALWPETAAWHHAMGHRFGAGVPMMYGKERVGVLSLAWDKSVDTQPSAASLKICVALTQQATTAVRLSRLAEEARAAAWAREREQAAQERAAQLERANAVLFKTIEASALEESPEGFLDVILHTIAAVLGVDTVTMWRLPGDDHGYLYRVLDAGVVLPVEQFDHLFPNRQVFIPDHPWIRDALEAGRHVVEVIHLDSHKGVSAEVIAHLRSLGTRALVTATICSGTTIIGAFSARLLEKHLDPGPEQLALIRSLAAQAALAMEMSRLTEAVRDGAILEERTRIARDLHDSLAQGFTGIIMQLEAVDSALGSEDPVKARARAAAAGEMARDSLQQARRAVQALRPSILEGTDLAAALPELIQSTFTGSPVEVETRFNGTSRPLSPETEEHLLRIAQEALTNVLKHSRAQHASLWLTYLPDEVILTIHDDGRGFDSSNRRPGAHGGLGLVGIRERAQRLGAVLTVGNGPDGGARIGVALPTRRSNG